MAGSVRSSAALAGCCCWLLVTVSIAFCRRGIALRRLPFATLEPTGTRALLLDSGSTPLSLAAHSMPPPRDTPPLPRWCLTLSSEQLAAAAAAAAPSRPPLLQRASPAPAFFARTCCTLRAAPRCGAAVDTVPPRRSRTRSAGARQRRQRGQIRFGSRYSLTPWVSAPNRL